MGCLQTLPPAKGLFILFEILFGIHSCWVGFCHWARLVFVWDSRWLVDCGFLFGIHSGRGFVWVPLVGLLLVLDAGFV